jgi:hypothetical protein
MSRDWTNEWYLVDGRVVDDFVGEPDALLGELLARLVCDLHGALDAPAEPVRLGELDGDQAPRVRLPVVPESLDHVTCGTPIRFACRQLGWQNKSESRIDYPAPRARCSTYWCTPGS